MILPQFLRRNGVFLLLLPTLVGCSYLIPENPSAPRYNTVTGERRVPKLNTPGPQSMNPAPALASKPVAMDDAPRDIQQNRITQTSSVEMPMPVAARELPAPDASTQSTNLYPPVSAATEQRAQQELAMNSQNSLPPALIPSRIRETSELARQVPVENMQEAPQLAQSSVPLQSVPQRPDAMTGPGSEQERLNRVRMELERDRANAANAKAQLGRDAASEPSMLNAPLAPPPSSGAPAPAPEPISVPPVNRAPIYPAPQSMNAPAQGIIAPPPVFAPPPPPMPMNNAQSWNEPAPSNPPAPLPQSAPQTVSYNYAPEPIVLRPPPASGPVIPAKPTSFQPTAQVQYVPQPMLSGSSSGFDPMAGANVSVSSQPTSYTSQDYLPSSRYNTKR